MTYEQERLKQAIAKVGSDTQGEAAFIRDLAMARLGDGRLEQVLNDLLLVADPAVIDEVVESPLLKANKEYKAIQFMGQILKQRLALGISDEEWKGIEDEEAA